MKTLLLSVTLLSPLFSFSQEGYKATTTQLGILNTKFDNSGESTFVNAGDTVTIFKPMADAWNAEYKGKKGFIKEVYLTKDAKYLEYKNQFKKIPPAADRKTLLIKKYGIKNGTDLYNGIVRLGMTKAMVKEVYGTPDDINRTVTQYSTHEQWVYDDEYFYFDNGKLTGWQD